MSKSFFVGVLFITTLFSSAPLAHAMPGDQCAYPPPSGTQPGILDIDERCVPDPADCNPNTQSCVASGCDPLTQSCPIEPPPEPEGPNPPPPQGSCSPNAPFCALAPIPGLTDNTSTSVVNSETLAVFLNNLYKYLLGIAAAAAVIEIIWGGIQMAVNRDSVSALLDSKGRVLRAIQGLILVFAPFLVFSIINPAILNLSIGLQELEPGPAILSGNLPPTPTSGCTPGPANNEYFEAWVCASKSAAQSQECTNTDLDQTIGPCARVSASTGQCIDTSSTMYCSGGSIELLSYMYYTTTRYNPLDPFKPPVSWPDRSTWSWAPSTRSSAAQFENACRSAGGKSTNDSGWYGSKPFVLSVLPSWLSACPESENITFDPADYAGAICFNTTATCEAPI
jgi:hypothetical protein